MVLEREYLRIAVSVLHNSVLGLRNLLMLHWSLIVSFEWRQTCLSSATHKHGSFGQARHLLSKINDSFLHVDIILKIPHVDLRPSPSKLQVSWDSTSFPPVLNPLSPLHPLSSSLQVRHSSISCKNLLAFPLTSSPT